MSKFFGALVFWGVVIFLGAAGLFSGQSSLMGICFAGILPATFALGWFAHGNIRVEIGAKSEDRPRTPARPISASPELRKRKVSDG